MTDDPWPIWSPESSDGQRFGDWQTTAVECVFALAALALFMWWVT